MDASGSEWSSGCESGWTVYLDESNSFYSNRHKTSTKGKNGCQYEEEEEEDLSMVSDASSGPRHNFHEEEQEEEASYGSQGGFYNYHASSSSSSLKKKGERRKKTMKGKDPRGGGGKYQNQASSYNHLDDTASSPALTYSKRHIHPSDNQSSFFGLSSPDFKGSSVCDNRFRFWHSSNPKKPD